MTLDQAKLDDEGAREVICHDLFATVFVEAGAGSGKTSELVRRISQIVLSGAADIEHIAAITFTEAAAGDLREKVGASLERCALDPTISTDERERARVAVRDIDAAAIGTLHSFARTLLVEHAFDAGIPPAFEVLDEVSSQVDFDDRWAEFKSMCLEQSLSKGPSFEEGNPTLVTTPSFHVGVGLSLGISLNALGIIARSCNENWDLIRPLDLGETLPYDFDVTEIEEKIEKAFCVMTACKDQTDHLYVHLEGLKTWVNEINGASGLFETIDALVEGPTLKTRYGMKTNWDVDVAEVREWLVCAEELREEMLSNLCDAALRNIGNAIFGFVLDAAQDRCRKGRLEFHDLLVRARSLLKSHPGALNAAHEQYRFILIDEFQDTDPLQAEIAVRIAGGLGGQAEKRWTQIQIPQGSLFFVGDPKQSIYRFRRADIAQYQKVKDLYAGVQVNLTSNFRSVPGVLSWVNAVMAQVIGTGRDGVQPAYVPLVAGRGGMPRDHKGDRPKEAVQRKPVVVLGGSTKTSSSAETLRTLGAKDIVCAIRTVIDQRWPVGDEGRDPCLSDITILIPGRTGLWILQRELDEASIPYRLESTSLVYSSQEVRDLLSVLRAIAEPFDQVAILGALRSPMLGCDDADLLQYRLENGPFVISNDPKTHQEHADVGRVGRALRFLSAWQKLIWWSDVHEIVETVLAETHTYASRLGTPRPREVWRHLQFVCDDARKFSEVYGGDLKRYLRWVESQKQEDARVSEYVHPELDDESVRIMTVHAAKGLEFPIVVVTGLDAKRRSRGGPRLLWGDGGHEISIKGGIATSGYLAMAEREDTQELAERDRLFYVAATRARDALILNLRHKEKTDCMARTIKEICNEYLDLTEPLLDLGLTGPFQPPSFSKDDSENEDLTAPITKARWVEARSAVIDTAKKQRVLAATAVPKVMAASRLAPKDDEAASMTAFREEGIEEPEESSRASWRRGRARTSLGRAVHATLQRVDFRNTENVLALAATEATVEGISERKGDVFELAQVALHSPLLQSLQSARRYWKEFYIAAPVGKRAIEGFVDLLIEDDDGYRVVDYKTDHYTSLASLEELVKRYRYQGVAYALALEAGFGCFVKDVTFLFLDKSKGAIARQIEGVELKEAKDEIRAEFALL